MKTPDEIKKGLEMYLGHSEEECADMCRDSECPYKELPAPNGESCGDLIRSDALSYIQQLEVANTELLTKVEQLEAKCHQLERERDAAVECIGELMVILKRYPYAATNGCAYQAYCEIQKYIGNMRGVKEE